MSQSVIVIPARYGSTRFPGKPLIKVAGKTLIQRVWEIAVSASSKQQVYVATDDERIAKAVEGFSGQCLMTTECRNGSERVMAAVRQLSEKPDIIVNFQGDAVLTPPEVLKTLINSLESNLDYMCATPAVELGEEAYQHYSDLRNAGSSSGTFVVFNKDYRALYFSNALLPYYRDSKQSKKTFKHIGIYAYRYAGLEKYLSLEPSALEQAESLEQLRMLENGIDILITPVDLAGRQTCSIDNPEDVPYAEKLIQEQGELCG